MKIKIEETLEIVPRGTNRLSRPMGTQVPFVRGLFPNQQEYYNKRLFAVFVGDVLVSAYDNLTTAKKVLAFTREINPRACIVLFETKK